MMTTMREKYPKFYHEDGEVSSLSTSRNLQEKYHTFEGHAIRYVKGTTSHDDEKPNVILIHGFGGERGSVEKQHELFCQREEIQRVRVGFTRVRVQR